MQYVKIQNVNKLPGIKKRNKEFEKFVSFLLYFDTPRNGE